MKKQQKNSILRAVLVIAFDLLLAGVLLLTFAFFHHVLPAIQSELESQRREEQLQQTQHKACQQHREVHRAEHIAHLGHLTGEQGQHKGQR